MKPWVVKWGLWKQQSIRRIDLETSLYHRTGVTLGVSCIGPGTGLPDPHWSLPIQYILWFCDFLHSPNFSPCSSTFFFYCISTFMKTIVDTALTPADNLGLHLLQFLIFSFIFLWSIWTDTSCSSSILLTLLLRLAKEHEWIFIGFTGTHIANENTMTCTVPGKQFPHTRQESILLKHLRHKQVCMVRHMEAVIQMNSK